MALKNKLHTEWIVLGCIILVGLAIFAFRIHRGVLDYGGDYGTYVSTAQFLAGVPGVPPANQRLLKPLEPLLNAALAPVIGWQGSFLCIVGLFYVLLGAAVWHFFKSFFGKLQLDGFSILALTASATALFMLSYPMLRYGLDVYTETGALFFYVVGLIGVWKFLDRPSWKPAALALVASTLGFLWKEYSILPVVMMQIAILWHPLLKGQTKRKALYLIVFDGIFLLANLTWQFFVYIYFHYDYVQWYLQGGANHFQQEWSIFIVLKSLFALLILGWAFVPFGFKYLRKQSSTVGFFFWLIALIPLVCLGWGAVSSRLFYVCVPAFLILCVLGMRRWCRSSADLVAMTTILLAIDFMWLFLHL